MPSSTPSTCHPAKPRKTSDGLCDTCYKRRRYHEDLDYREAVLARNRKPERPVTTGTCTCGATFETIAHNRLYCSKRCRKRAYRTRHSSSQNRAPVRRPATNIATGQVVHVHTEELDTGGLWVWCNCGAMTGIEGHHRYCWRCRTTLALHQGPARP